MKPKTSNARGNHFLDCESTLPILVSRGHIERLNAAANSCDLHNWLQKTQLVLKKALRMDSEKFIELLRLVMPAVEKQNFRMRMAISRKTKREITLCYLASGDSFRSLALLFRVQYDIAFIFEYNTVGYFSSTIPHNGISTFLPDVLAAMYEGLDTAFFEKASGLSYHAS